MRQKIKNYIDFYAPDKIKQRGKALYKNGAVTYSHYDNQKKAYYFKVQGTKLYTVKLSITNNAPIKSSCTCPFTWGEICKHTVAALLYASDYLISKNKNKIKTNHNSIPNKVYRKAHEPAVIENFESFEKNDLLKYAKGERFKLGLDKNFKIENFNFKDNFLSFDIRYDKYWGSDYYLVTCQFKNDNLYLNSDQNTRAKKDGLKTSEWFILQLLFQHKEALLKLINPKKRIDIKSYFTDQFGLPVKDFDKYFQFGFDEKHGLYTYKLKAAEGLVRIDGEHEMNAFIQKLSELDQKPALPVHARLPKDRLLGFAIRIVRQMEQNVMFYECIAAKPNKAKTKLISRFSEYDPEVDDDVEILPGQQKIVNWIVQYEEIDEDDDDLIHSFSLSQKIFKAISQEDHVFFNDSPYQYNLHKSDLVPAKLSPEFAKTVLVVKQNKQFVSLQAFIKIGNDLVALSKIDKERSDYKIICYNDIFYHLHNIKDAYMIINYSTPLKIAKSHKDVLYEKIIEPLAKNYEVQFADKTFDYEQVALDYQKKQVYLTEEEDYIIIKLQVVYDNNMEVLLTTDGDYVQRNPETGKIIKYIRNKELENDFIDEISNLHPDFEEQKHQRFFYIHFEDFVKDMWFYQFFEYLNKHQIEVYGVKQLKKFKYSPHKAKITTAVSSGQDWFDVNVDISFGNNQVKLKDIKRAIVNKQKFIQLNDGSVGILPDEWLHKLEKYFRNASQVSDDSLQISKMRFSIVDELFEQQDQLEILEEIAAKKQRLKSFKEIKNVTVPKEITAQLRPYQKEGLNWLHFLNEMQWGGILADDMGLGKTLQVLTFLQDVVKKDKTPNLIIVPTTLLFNWQKEIEKFAPKLKAYYHYGPDRQQNTNEFKNYDLIFTTYGTLLRDIEWLHQFAFNYAILDESQAIKNPSSRRFKAVSLLRTKNRIAMTGTPIENSTFDLYAQMSFVNPGFFINIKNFKDNYSNPIDKDGDESVANELQKLINPFILRRTKEQVATELPPKVEDVIYCEMPPAQRKVYDAYRNQYRDKLLNQIEKEGLAKSKFMVLEALTRLRQICDSPLLLNDESIAVKDSIKIQEMIAHITDKTAQHKVLIFSQFTSMLALLKNELDALGIAYEYLDGKSTSKQREASVQNFQTNDDLRVFLISLKAGGTGLNLTAADYVYILDPWWNPAVENQAIDRIYRIGQDKKVFAYRMICKDTVEEKILDLQAKKKKIATDIIQTDDKIMKSLKVDDIKNLLG